MRAAVVQMSSRADRGANLATAEGLVRRAAAEGARLVVLPEKWAFIHGPRTAEAAEALDGPSLSAAADWARALGIVILAGSIIERREDGRVHNTSVLIDAAGGAVAVYRKMHMFDVEVGGVRYHESAVTRPGEVAVCADADGLRLGMSVCYDLRFPELYRRLVADGARALAVPAAFTLATGRDHWQPLVRARAIENQCFVLAAGQFGTHDDGTISFGRSMIVDPWGVVLAQAGDGEGVAVADLDLAHQDRIRASLPALAHRRSELA